MWTGGASSIGTITISSTVTSPNSGSNTLNLGNKEYCSLSYYFKDSKFGGYCNVYKSGLNWYVTAYKAGGDGAATRCKAICF